MEKGFGEFFPCKSFLFYCFRVRSPDLSLTEKLWSRVLQAKSLRFYYFLVDSPDLSPTEKLWSSVLVSFFHIKLDTFLFWCLDSRCESHWKVVE